jgi:hypothetical protein
MIRRGCAEQFVRTVVTAACDCCAAIFFVNPAMRRRAVRRVSQNGSRPGPNAIANSWYRDDVLAETVVRKLAS